VQILIERFEAKIERKSKKQEVKKVNKVAAPNKKAAAK
jgi:hypothetical protein